HGESAEPHIVACGARWRTAAVVRRCRNKAAPRRRGNEAGGGAQPDWDTFFLLARRAAAQDGAVTLEENFCVRACAGGKVRKIAGSHLEPDGQEERIDSRHVPDPGNGNRRCGYGSQYSMHL